MPGHHHRNAAKQNSQVPITVINTGGTDTHLSCILHHSLILQCIHTCAVYMHACHTYCTSKSHTPYMCTNATLQILYKRTRTMYMYGSSTYACCFDVCSMHRFAWNKRQSQNGIQLLAPVTRLILLRTDTKQ